jgi:broad specificity phosphatase PhoE
MKKIIFVRHGESTENLANKKGEKYDESNIQSSRSIED